MGDVLLTTPAGVYRWRENWASVPVTDTLPQNGRTHGVAVSNGGQVFIFHQSVPAVLTYSPDGILLASWGNYPGAHGFTLVEEQGEEFFWLTDQDRAVVEKTTTDGKIVAQIAAPAYAAGERYIPTWVAVNEKRHGGNGDVWVADGYGSSRVHRYDASGAYISTLDGTEGGGRFSCPHGIWFNSRKKPMELYVADRGNHRVQVYDGQGKYLRTFGEGFLTSPDIFAADGERLVVPELFGRVTILDKDDRLICHLGSNDGINLDPAWPNDTPLSPGKFNSPHGATADSAGNIYIVEWRVGGRIVKLEKCA